MNDLPHVKKSLGQHWLTDRESLEAMCDAAAVSSADTVLEIGPGLGTLTELLAQAAAQVVAVEFDEKLANELPDRIRTSNLQVVTEDILRFDFGELPPDYKVVANIPYYLTSNLIRVLSETPNRPKVAALLVQKEVAERVAASPGGMSLLSVTAQFYWHVSLGDVIPASLFTPPPKVDSQILALTRRSAPLFPEADPRAFFRVVRAGFSQRRKTLLNSLSSGLRLSREVVEGCLQAAHIDSARRAQTLSLDEWYQAYRGLEK